MELTMDTDEVRISRSNNHYVYGFRFANTNNYYSDGENYQSNADALANCLISMALTNKERK